MLLYKHRSGDRGITDIYRIIFEVHFFANVWLFPKHLHPILFSKKWLI